MMSKTGSFSEQDLEGLFNSSTVLNRMKANISWMLPLLLRLATNLYHREWWAEVEADFARAGSGQVNIWVVDLEPHLPGWALRLHGSRWVDWQLDLVQTTDTKGDHFELKKGASGLPQGLVPELHASLLKVLNAAVEKFPDIREGVEAYINLGTEK